MRSVQPLAGQPAQAKARLTCNVPASNVQLVTGNGLDPFGFMKTKTNNNGNKDILRELRLAYAMELETVQNYIANSVHLDGVRSEVVKKELAADIPVEVGHAQQLAHRIKTLGGRVPGSLELTRTQTLLQPPEDSTNVVSVIKGVIAAEKNAITQYKKIIGLCEQRDFVTQELAIQLLGNEEEHYREFSGFLKEYQN